MKDKHAGRNRRLLLDENRNIFILIIRGDFSFVFEFKFRHLKNFATTDRLLFKTTQKKTRFCHKIVGPLCSLV